MKDGTLYFFKTAGIKETGLTKREHETYLEILDEWTQAVPDITGREMQIVLSFIERQIRYYLNVCAKRKMRAALYEGCMENLLFLLGYLLHFYFWKVGKNYLQKLYDMATGIDALQPVCYAEVADYVIRTGLAAKIHFFMDYYFSK
ncbi:MAG: hypothetical protein IJU25_03775 [Lachnospiraceae bacterium]|nr:hypothetical protein [Lachnospiraceae bacterium]